MYKLINPDIMLFVANHALVYWPHLSIYSSIEFSQISHMSLEESMHSTTHTQDKATIPAKIDISCVLFPRFNARLVINSEWPHFLCHHNSLCTLVHP